MPLADADEQRAFMRERYRERLENEPGFRERESARRKANYARNARYRKRVIAAVKACRERLAEEVAA
jgi:hypothetical protein